MQPEPAVGLGVSVSPSGDCQLAVRYPWFDTSRAPFREELTELTTKEVDFDWTGPVRASTTGGAAYGFRGRRRPLAIGSSIAHDQGSAGTICAFVQRGGGAPELLSCNHVLADCGRVQPNATILQPGPVDGGMSRDVVGRLAFAYPIERRSENVVDCAVATLDTGVEADLRSINGRGELAGLVDPGWFDETAAGQKVAKIGRTTGYTVGTVTVLSFTEEIEYSIGLRSFTDMIEIEGDNGPFAEYGDSGSLVYTVADRRAVGMIIAVADGGKAYMTRLDTVLSRLGAQLAI